MATNSIADFKSTKSYVLEHTASEKNADFKDTFICHLLLFDFFLFPFSIFCF